jgi:hypothetical protein
MLLEVADEDKALQVVKHDFALKERAKMTGAEQRAYPRKWWSAVVLWNTTHPSHSTLRLNDVNCRPGTFLHRFGWLPDEEIGDLPPGWHWLEGYDEPLPDGDLPELIHYTRGGPWFADWHAVDYAEEWRTVAREMRTIGAVQSDAR